MRYSRALLSAIVAILPLFASSYSHAQRITYKTREVAAGLNVPWELRFGPDGWIYFTERPGWFSKVNPETGEVKRLLVDAESRLWNEAGMLGFDFHPDFPDSPFIYISKSHWPAGEETTMGLFRYRYTGDTLTDRVRIFGPAKASHTHVGSRVIIHDRKIFFSLGEVWEFMLAQDIFSANGKINRINLDGSIPDDNPIQGASAWTTGHRNPQGLDFAPDGTLYSSEHGHISDDEINIIEKGRNYGWPIVEGFCDADSDYPNCEAMNVREPLVAFTPTIATGDIAYFDHPTFPEWRHSILLATLKDQSLYHLKLSEDGRSIVWIERYNLLDGDGEPYGRLRSICLSKDGRIFISTSNGQGPETRPDRIFELIRTGIEPSSTTLVSPLDSAKVNSSVAVMNWRKSFLSAKYQVQLSDTNDFGIKPLIFDREIMDTALRFVLLKPGKRYYWRVRESSTGGSWSETRSFTTDLAAVGSEISMAASVPMFEAVSRGHNITLIAGANMLNTSVEIIDNIGRKRDSFNIQDLAQGAERTVGLFDPGVYFVRVRNMNGATIRRVLIL
jgi:aldose sugar dehydrogenase